MTKTAFICTALVIAVTIYDVIAIQIGGIDASVSRWVQDMGLSSPVIVFGVGFLCGHWFGYMKPKSTVIESKGK